MKLHLEGTRDSTRIGGYGDHHVSINGARYTRSLILTPERVIPDWPPQRFEEIAPEHLVQLATCGAEILLLGTGSRQQFLAPALLAPLVTRGVNVDVMTTPAACRTFNILVSDGRLVAAALLMIAA